MRHFVLGTAGHIDHGKSALVRALTGTDPDRLKEEKARGITIELGFADLDLGEGRTLSIVDVPGHERFVRHMVAGATGIDAVLLVVAADQGVQPQTREHLQICNLLGIRHGLVVLTKSDLADEDLQQVVALEVAEFLEGSFLESAPMAHASARTGEGLEEVRKELGDLFRRVEDREVGGIARLPVDRSFVLHGFGTVVTGTLVSGTFREGQEVEIQPGGAKTRIRGLQVHGAKVPEAQAGRRTAVNLQGMHCDDVPRGSTITVPGALETTRRIWARLSLLPTAPDQLRKGGSVRFHHGTCERAGRFRVLGEADDGTLDIELFLDQETLLVPGDRFICRRPAPVDTIGGGEVLDIKPPRGKAARKERHAYLAGDPEEAVLVRLMRSGRAGCEIEEVSGALGVAAGELEQRLQQLEDEGRLVRAAGRLFVSEVVGKLREDILGAVERFHRDEPLRKGTPREPLRARLCPEMPLDAWRTILEGLREGGEITLDGEILALASHAVKLTPGQKASLERIDGRLRQAGLDPPDPAEVLAGEGGEEALRLVDLLLGDGRIVRLGDGRLFHSEALERLYVRLREYAESSTTIDVPTFKKLAGVTRKNAIPLLEFLDAERRTRRIGNVREILGVKGSAS